VNWTEGGRQEPTYGVGERCELTVTLSPPNCTDVYIITASGANTAINGNTVTCLAAGAVTVKVTAQSGVTAETSISVIDLAAYEAEVVRLVNAERAKASLPALSAANTLLGEAASVRAKEIIVSFDHTRPDGRAPATAYEDLGGKYTGRFRGLGENIAYGQHTPALVTEAWMNSDGHRQNILKTDYTHIGVGLALDGRGVLYWCQLFYG
jgi:uncharacterized protein YkwD